MYNRNTAYYQRHRWTYPKDEDKNFVAGFFHLLSIVLIVTSLIQLNWFRIWGSHCPPHLSTSQFFGLRDRYPIPHNLRHEIGSEHVTFSMHHLNSTISEASACVTRDVVSLMHLLIFLSSLAIFTSALGFCLDMVGPTRWHLKMLRKNAVPSITTVLIVIAIIGTSYFVIRALEISISGMMNIQSDVQITFDYGCYVITAAGSFSILATACNLLQTQSGGEDLVRHSRLVEDWEGPETFSVGLSNIPPPPPPYTP